MLMKSVYGHHFGRDIGRHLENRNFVSVKIHSYPFLDPQHKGLGTLFSMMTSLLSKISIKWVLAATLAAILQTKNENRTAKNWKNAKNLPKKISNINGFENKLRTMMKSKTSSTLKGSRNLRMVLWYS